MNLRQTSATIALALFGALVAASPAAGSRTQETIFDATNDLLLAPTAEARDATLDDLRALGVDTVRVVVPWRGLVPGSNSPRRPESFDPTDPAAYHGGVIQALDHVVRGTEERGMKLLLSPSSPTPDWASASGRSSVASPKPIEFRQLLTGLGRRYDGSFGGVPCIQPLPPPLDTVDCVKFPFIFPPLPRVSFWSMWNEPNLDLFLRPQRRRGLTVSGAAYRNLFRAGMAGLRVSGHGDDPVLVGETAPSGGHKGTPPLDFMRQVLARGPVGAAGWAHHPYDPNGTPLTPSSRRLLSIPALGGLGKPGPRSAPAPSLPVYVTEYGVESRPDRRYGVPLARQAEYLGLAEYSLWRNPRVRSFGQYLMRDDANEFEYSFQTGLRFLDGRRKPAYSAFAMTLVVREPQSGPLRFWGHVRPGEGSRVVQVKASGGRLVRRATTDADGYFQFSAPARRATRWRARAELPGGRVVQGSWIRSYRFD
ncbi:MAG TPA: hypothetical protein VKA89_10925 [Solirubrobacterales bacterium]|nr:hypothetical protein [Solirubrobacterales bacterium]